MAAHPFGPIETFLLRGFNKKQLELDRVDPKFMFSRKVEIPTTNTHPLFAFYKEVTHGVQRTAIVNSSDYEVKFGAQWPNTDLLSRGLGYRITFTMPADKEFNIQDADTYPSVEITVTDALGGEVFPTFGVNGLPTHLMQEFRTHLVRCIPLLKTLVEVGPVTIEYTTVSWRVFHGSVLVQEVPVFIDNESQLSAETEKCVGNHSLFFRTKSLHYLETVSLQIGRRTALMADSLSRNHLSLTPEKKSSVQAHVLHLLSMFCKLYQNCASALKRSPIHATTLESLQKDLTLWFNGQGSYPLNFSAQLVWDICHQIDIEFQHFRNSTLALLDWRGIFSEKVVVLEQNISSLIRAAIGCVFQSEFKEKPIRVLSANTYTVTCSTTARFRLSNSPNKEEFELFDLFLGEARRFEDHPTFVLKFLVPDRELAIFEPALFEDDWTFGNPFGWYVIHLNEAYKLRTQGASELKPATTLIKSNSVIAPQSLVTQHGIILFQEYIRYNETNKVRFFAYEVCVPGVKINFSSGTELTVNNGVAVFSRMYCIQFCGKKPNGHILASCLIGKSDLEQLSKLSVRIGTEGQTLLAGDPPLSESLLKDNHNWVLVSLKYSVKRKEFELIRLQLAECHRFEVDKADFKSQIFWAQGRRSKRNFVCQARNCYDYQEQGRLPAYLKIFVYHRSKFLPVLSKHRCVPHKDRLQIPHLNLAWILSSEMRFELIQTTRVKHTNKTAEYLIIKTLRL